LPLSAKHVDANEVTYICRRGGIGKIGNVVVGSNKLCKIVKDLIEYFEILLKIYMSILDSIKWKHTFTPLGNFLEHITIFGQPMLKPAST
jgi:hypothetical protein